MPACRNCGHGTRFVLLFDLAVGFTPDGGFDAPGWSLSLQCAECASTDVSGDPAAVAAALLDDGVVTRGGGRSTR